MSHDVHWVRLAIDIFEDEKIQVIESMPEGDALIVIWIKLITQAGKCNNGGQVFLSPDIPFTPETLATVLRRPLTTVKLALDTFLKLGMVAQDNERLYLPNWPKHQNVDGLAKLREAAKLRMRRLRNKQQSLTAPAENVTRTVREQPENVTRTLRECYANVTRTKGAKGAQSQNVTRTLRERSHTEGEVEVEVEVDTTTPTTEGEKLAKMIKVYEENIGMATPTIYEQIKSMDYPDGWFELAVAEAASYQKRSLRYIEAILERWRVEGLPSKVEKNGKSTKPQGIPGNQPSGAFSDVETP